MAPSQLWNTKPRKSFLNQKGFFHWISKTFPQLLCIRRASALDQMYVPTYETTTLAPAWFLGKLGKLLEKKFQAEGKEDFLFV